MDVIFGGIIIEDSFEQYSNAYSPILETENGIDI